MTGTNSRVRDLGKNTKLRYERLLFGANLQCIFAQAPKSFCLPATLLNFSLSLSRRGQHFHSGETKQFFKLFEHLIIIQCTMKFVWKSFDFKFSHNIYVLQKGNEKNVL